MSDDDVPPDVLRRLRSICLALPDAYEEPAWIGTRWRVRGKTFAHVYAVEPGESTVLAQIARPDGLTVAVAFRAPAEEVEAIRAAGPPYFVAGWGRDVVGALIDDDTDWVELREVLVESYVVKAPKKLAAQVLG